MKAALIAVLFAASPASAGQLWGICDGQTDAGIEKISDSAYRIFGDGHGYDCVTAGPKTIKCDNGSVLTIEQGPGGVLLVNGDAFKPMSRSDNCN